MKAIMLSINPEWGVKVLNGEKEYEARKTKPHCELPVDVYMYITKGDKNNCLEYADNPRQDEKGMWVCGSGYPYANGKVVAKFTLDRVEEIKYHNGQVRFYSKGNEHQYSWLKETCLTFDELDNYLKGKNGYAWHISNLVIFDEPKELKNFLINSHTVSGIGFKGEEKQFKILEPLKRAPESYCYIEID
jgi:predicted transcriptional regulator